MALSRRLFIGGLLAAAAAPAIITSKGFKPAVVANPFPWIEPFSFNQLHYHGTVTGRMSSSEPAWHELERVTEDALVGNVRDYQRNAIKQILFAERYGVHRTMELERGLGKGRTLIDLDYSELERRVIAQRETRGLFDDLKIR